MNQYRQQRNSTSAGYSPPFPLLQSTSSSIPYQRILAWTNISVDPSVIIEALGIPSGDRLRGHETMLVGTTVAFLDSSEYVGYFWNVKNDQMILASQRDSGSQALRSEVAVREQEQCFRHLAWRGSMVYLYNLVKALGGSPILVESSQGLVPLEANRTRLVSLPNCGVQVTRKFVEGSGSVWYRSAEEFLEAIQIEMQFLETARNMANARFPYLTTTNDNFQSTSVPPVNHNQTIPPLSLGSYQDTASTSIPFTVVATTTDENMGLANNNPGGNLEYGSSSGVEQNGIHSQIHGEDESSDQDAEGSTNYEAGSSNDEDGSSDYDDEDD